MKRIFCPKLRISQTESIISLYSAVCTKVLTCSTRHRSLATGLVFCGSGVGIFTLAPVTNLILHNYGWRWVMRTLSALAGAGVLPGATMIPVHSHAEKDDDAVQEQDQDNDATPHLRRLGRLLSLILGEDLAAHQRVGNYMTFVLTNFLRFISVYITFTHLPTFAEVRIRSTDR